MNLYNEIDDFACGWLSNLIDAGKIPPGKIDNRPIQEITLDDLTGYTQCHFFAGIGGWAYALQLAGWPNDKHVWTGSCPCQPFSSAGKQKGKEDERHLWPVWFNLIRQSRPPIVFGEQVSSAILHHWWDDVADDLEGEGYTTRAEIRPACSVGAPHKRDRLWFAAHAEGERSGRASGSGCETTGRSETRNGLQLGRTSDERGDVADSNYQGSQGRTLYSECADQLSAWSSGVEWINCPDGKQRLIEPSIPLLADGVSNRVGKLRGYGNAIVPQVAAQFIREVIK
jgi:DNA (cytosine-5)-methyltransferase 1